MKKKITLLALAALLILGSCATTSKNPSNWKKEQSKPASR